PLWIDLDDQILQAGQEYAVAFEAKDLAQVQGYQFGLSYAKNQVELTDIRYGLAKPENFGIFKEEGLITTNWYTDQAQLNPDAVLFTLVFRAQSSGKLSQILRLSQRRMLSEAYDFADERKPVQLRFNNNLVQSQTFELYQNIPNPFQDATSIRFYLPEATDGHLLIFDAAGRLLQDLKGNYQRGLNQIDLEVLQLPAGVLYYTFRSTRYTATKKMQRIGF
ncbi:T9SS type A sorting domain-containing protein, partial [Haliscomenobacter sp.]|uniref:T9SS type A sorting domain-containing protein n=1 Tax=Haliscomenobacter sp. TaxID=2717303 RepID=UPI003364F472